MNSVALSVEEASKKHNNLAYWPEFFDAVDFEGAKDIILSGHEQLTQAQRWATESDYLLDLIDKQVDLGPHSVILDYGCGVGRLSKALIDRYDCTVVGADISYRMRSLANDYVQREKFFCLHPHQLKRLGHQWADMALSVWVLQHCAAPIVDISNIVRALKPRGGVFVVNETNRCIPARSETGDCWVFDDIDIFWLLRGTFESGSRHGMDALIVGSDCAQRAYWAYYKRPKRP